MINQANFSRLPLELQAVKQWCVAAPDKSPYTARVKMHKASIHKSDHWETFDTAVSIAKMAGPATAIGIVLNYNDPWTIIDLDVVNEESQREKGEPVDPKLWTTEEQFQRFASIIETFDSYTERSQSGRGWHIFVEGSIGLGVKYDGVEIYSQERFMICTGNVYRDRPIRKDKQEILDTMVDWIRDRQGKDARTKKERFELVEVPEVDGDDVIVSRLLTAENSEKANILFQGNWQGRWTSQSEADLALMSMITFYTPSNAQARRVFRISELGQRTKATKNDRHLNYMLEMIRARETREKMVDEGARQIALENVKAMQEAANKGVDQFPEVIAVRAAVQAAPVISPEGSTIGWPPGVFGQICSFIYNSSIRPVKEVAIVSALGLAAGIAGKAYNVSHSGLNLYVTLIGRSGVGKEALHSGMSLILQQVRATNPEVDNFVDFVEYKSGAGLSKAIIARKSFVNLSGEWGRKLKRMANDSQDGTMADLRTTLTHLYQKSGHGSDVGGLGYSDKEKNIDSVTGVAYSLIGETTPGTFYECLTPGMMEDGFMSRFVLVDYQGDRPDRNKAPARYLPPMVAQAVGGLANRSDSMIKQGVVCDVISTPEAQKLLDDFDLECDRRIRATDDESVRQMWNRAHLKVLKVSALIAACENWMEPCIRENEVEWALKLIRNDINLTSRKMNDGDVGIDDHARERKMVALMRSYVEKGVTSDNTYGATVEMHKAGIIPRRMIQMRLSRVAQFTHHRNGPTKAMDETLRLMIANGYIVPVDKPSLMKEYSYGGDAYRILTLQQDIPA